MRKAGTDDKELVVSILTKSFIRDPHINFLLEKSKNDKKMEVIMDYVVDETFSKGEIHINEDNTAVALWLSGKKEKFSFRFIHRNLSFLFKAGLASTIRSLKMEGLTNRLYPKKSDFRHLYLIGVLPEAQGKGYAKRLISAMIRESEQTKLPIYLETANHTNVTIYQRLGFSVFDKIVVNNHTLFCLNRMF